MKKLLSMLLAIVMVSSVFATSVFANSASLTLGTTSTDGSISVGDVFTLTIKTSEMSIAAADFKLTFDDYSKFEVVSCLNGKGKKTLSLPFINDDEEDDKKTLDQNNLENGTGLSWTWLGNEDINFNATTVVVVTLKAKEAGSYVATLTDNSVSDGRTKNETSTQAITIKGATPTEDKSITTANPTTGTDVKTWNVTLGKDFDGTTLKATLTNSAADEGNKTQDVTLTLPTGISGDAAFVFDINVKFQNFDNAATTTLAVTAE